MVKRDRTTIRKQLGWPAYWILFETEQCPVCGHENTYKTRMYTPKPKRREDRHKRCDIYCGCVI